MNRRSAILAGGAAIMVAAAAVPASAATPRLRLDGIGPLTLGMTTSQAVATGWLATPQPGCELESPRPVGYSLRGSSAPAGLRGSVIFRSGRLSEVIVDKGARTITGVRPGVTTARAMIVAYRRAGYWVTSVYEPVFQTRFITARRGGKTIVGIAPGISTAKVVGSLGVPGITACE